jgi:hypothetical protein
MSDRATGKTPSQVAWECLGAHRAQNWALLRTLLHPHARIGTFAGGGRPEDPETAIARLRKAHADFLYQAEVANLTELDSQAVVLEGRVQYRKDRGWADSERTWLYVVRHELLYRSAVYRSSDLARAEYETLGPTLGVPD